MEFSFIHIILAGIAVLFALLEFAIHIHKGDLKFSGQFPFIKISARKGAAAKPYKTVPKRKWTSRVLLPIVVLAFIVILFFTISFIFPGEAGAAYKKPIAVMAFKNLTGDESLDYLSEAIPSLLITNLEQSKYLSVMTWERMRDLLKARGTEDVKVISDDLAFELCRTDGVDFIVVGSFTKAGEVFATDAKVMDVSTKQLLKTTSAQGDGLASILKVQIDELSKEILHGVGLSERKIEKSKLTVADVTTSSLDAYNYFLRGRAEYEKFYFKDAIKFLQKAVELDSTFAMAYLYLAYSYGALVLNDERMKAFEKAKTYSAKATERERLYVDAYYARYVEKNPEKQIGIYKKIARLYPKEKEPHVALGEYYKTKKSYDMAINELNKALELDPTWGLTYNALGYCYAQIGNYEKADEYFRNYARVSPGDANPFDSWGDMYFLIGDLDKALAKYQEAIDVKPDFTLSIQKTIMIYAHREDYPETFKWCDYYIGITPSKGIKALIYLIKGVYLTWCYRLKEAFDNYNLSMKLTEELNNLQFQADIYMYTGWANYRKGSFKLSMEDFKKYLEIHLNADSTNYAFCTSNYLAFISLVLLNQKDTGPVRKNLQQMDSLQGAITKPLAADCKSYMIDGMIVNFIYGELLFNLDSLEKAIAYGEKLVNYPFILPESRDLLARIYKKKGEINKAIAVYEKLIVPNTAGITSDNILRHDIGLIHPFDHYNLAKLYEESGSIDKAIEQYDKFLLIMKDADTRIKEVDEARVRLAKLKKSKL